MKKSLNLVQCTECGTRLSPHAEACPECGYPHVAGTAISLPLPDDQDVAHAMLKEYRLLQIVGLVVVAAGLLAAVVDSRFAAGIALTIGATTYLSGLLGTWWNRGD